MHLYWQTRGRSVPRSGRYGQESSGSGYRLVRHSAGPQKSFIGKLTCCPTNAPTRWQTALPGSTWNLWRRFRCSSLTILEMRKLPPTAAEDLLEIAMRRYERASTLLTSKSSGGRLGEASGRYGRGQRDARPVASPRPRSQVRSPQLAHQGHSGERRVKSGISLRRKESDSPFPFPLRGKPGRAGSSPRRDTCPAGKNRWHVPGGGTPLDIAPRVECRRAARRSSPFVEGRDPRPASGV